MTVSTEVDHNDYTGNGVTTSFPYTFRIFQKSDLMVQVADLNENITVLTLDTDYTVTGAGGYSGGAVVLASPLTNGWQISISRDLPVTQETDLRNQGKFFAEVHEDAFDKLTMLIQQCFGFLRLALRKPSFIANYYDALNNRIKNLRDPSQDQDAATKHYVDDSVAGSNSHADDLFKRTLRVPESSVKPVPFLDIRKEMLLGFNSFGDPVAIAGQTETADLALKLAAYFGTSLIGMPLSGNLFDLVKNMVTPAMFHAKAGNTDNGGLGFAHDNSLCFQKMFNAVRDNGGGLVIIDDEYCVDFCLFPHTNTTVMFVGRGAMQFINPRSATTGRGGFIIGSSREFNFDQAWSLYQSGNYPGSIVNASFTDPAQKQYLRDNQQFVQAERVNFINPVIKAYYTDSTYWGGFAINCVNAQHIRILNPVFNGWTEGVNVGSDVPPNTPSCYDVKIHNMRVIKADLVRTYYAGFFFANSTNCEISEGSLETPLTAGTSNGSFGATNFTEDCVIRDINVPNLGRTVSSEGILINNTKGCLVKNIKMGNAKSAVSTFYVDATTNDANNPNFIDGVEANNCDQALAVTGKYALFSNVKAVNCLQELFFRNANATGNIFKSKPDSITISDSSAKLKYWYLINNTVSGWRRKYTWLRPLDILRTPFASLSSWNSNNSVKFNSGATGTFLYKIPESMNAVSGFTAYGDFSVGAAAAATDSVCTIDVISMAAVDGNQTAPVILLTASVSAHSNGDGIWSLSADVQSTSPGYLPMEGAASGVDNTMYLRVTYSNGVANNTLKEIGLRHYGV
ncbi:phage tail protein [Klebsiella aerogenes]|uniref:phage tail protein n=1 Tax=Klebsiella aerogenes TaxID=548 RepID=UPI000CE964F5|nr:phage tail protein [Klebsiella aerogenes]AVE99179.1 phage tail protein [Klebsiella aerogenes]